MTFWANWFAELTNVLDIIYANLTTGMVNYVEPVIWSFSVFLIGLTAFSVGLGWTNSPTRELLKSAFVIVLVMQFAGNLSGYTDNIGDYLRGLPEDLSAVTAAIGIGSGGTIGEVLDKFGSSIYSGLWEMVKSADGLKMTVILGLFAVVMAVAATIMMGIAAYSLMKALVSVTVLVSLGPLFILCLLFSSTRDFFSKWLTYTITFAIHASLVGVVLSIVDLMGSRYFEDFRDTTGDFDIFTLAAPGLLIFLISRVLNEVGSFATSLGGGIGMSMGSTVGSAVKAGAAPLAGAASAAWNRTGGERMYVNRSARIRGKIDAKRSG